MQLMIAADIFGTTQDLEDIAAQISPNSKKTTIVDPYEGVYQNFENEAAAYSHFQQKAGMARYKDVVYETTLNKKEDMYLVGFSVGAAAIWAISDQFGPKPDRKAICFYGSQIRHFMDVDPKIDIELIFPECEPHFDTNDLVAQLSLKAHVTCRTVPYSHGFMNRRSVHFDQLAFENYVNFLKAKSALHFASPA